MTPKQHQSITWLLYFVVLLYSAWMFVASFKIYELEKEVRILQGQIKGDTHEKKETAAHQERNSRE